MKLLYLDNIIFSLQRTGGISVYWSHCLNKSADVPLWYGCAWTLRLSANLHRRTIQLPEWLMINESTNPAADWRGICRYCLLSREPISFTQATIRGHCNVSKAGHYSIWFTYEFFSSGLKRFVHGQQKRHGNSNRPMGLLHFWEHKCKIFLSFFPSVQKKECG